ncbi:hypothetical protein OS122_30250 [Mycolicibacterium mucogenicum]|uniref:hypothetical protein n=1 Tax=Mycolicibacterium mucogenicum TaxID=56689 RepID=UPI002269F684|nr:hypothetical protein [Mycolicibacterium mucogenicum]MCX8565169.1 hypothetical protein [Mycolicibacterium mucogenicum]
MTSGIVQPLPFDSTLPSFGPPFMAHVPASQIEQIVPLTASDGVGAVIVTQSDTAVCRAVKAIRKVNPNASILIDKDRYSGRARRIGADGMGTAWINTQLHTLQLPWALTDSGYIPAGDTDALMSVLAWGKRSDRIIVTLPLALDWLRRDIDQLIDRVAAAECPVAIVLEAKGDPLSTRHAVQGLIKLLRAVNRALVLRCDTSTLGALAYGAAAVSVGVNSTHRHLYPVTTPKDNENEFRRSKVRTSVFIPQLLTYKLLNERLAAAIVLQPDADVWKCDCSQCMGRSLLWITTTDGSADTAAFQHSLCAQVQLAKELLAVTPMERPGWWKDRCAIAQPKYGQITDPSSSQPWAAPGALKAWVSSTPTPQELRG